MVSVKFLWMIFCLSLVVPPAKKEVSPTPSTLESWVKGKEIVEVCFAGPRMEPMKLRNSLKIKIPPGERDFLITPGEGGGVNRSFINICMKVAPENIRRLLTVQAELSVRGYPLDPKATRVWSYTGDAKSRAKARALIPAFLAGVDRDIRKSIPTAVCKLEKNRLSYEVPGTKVRGEIRVTEITTTSMWDTCFGPDQEAYLPHLGLMISQYYRPGQVDAFKDPSPYHAAIRKAFSQMVEPFLKLEPGAAVRTWPMIRRQ